MKSPRTGYARLWRGIGYAWAAALVALILLFYHWTHVTFTYPSVQYPYIAHGGSMYNLSVNGYLAHQLSFVIRFIQDPLLWIKALYRLRFRTPRSDLTSLARQARRGVIEPLSDKP